MRINAGFAFHSCAELSAIFLPAIRLPTRSPENVSYNKEAGYLELGAKEQVRALTVTTARAFAQTLRLMAASRAMVASNDFATKRGLLCQQELGRLRLRRTGGV